MYMRAINGESAPNKAPDVVFVAHGTELLSLFHLPFALRSSLQRPFKSEWWLQPFLPLCLPIVALLRLVGKTFVADKHRLLHLNCATWVTPAWGFQFFIKSEFGHINRKIAQAILAADKAGTKVIGLGALNKNEALNGGGQKFVDEHPDLNVRVVHGNTLTAAAILKDARRSAEIFLTGSTSKLGRAIALYMSARGVKVVMYTTSQERFEKIRNEAMPEHRRLLTQATTLAEEGEHQGLGRGEALLRVGPSDERRAPRRSISSSCPPSPKPEKTACTPTCRRSRCRRRRRISARAR